MKISIIIALLISFCQFGHAQNPLAQLVVKKRGFFTEFIFYGMKGETKIIINDLESSMEKTIYFNQKKKQTKKIPFLSDYFEVIVTNGDKHASKEFDLSRQDFSGKRPSKGGVKDTEQPDSKYNYTIKITDERYEFNVQKLIVILDEDGGIMDKKQTKESSISIWTSIPINRVIIYQQNENTQIELEGTIE